MSNHRNDENQKTVELARSFEMYYNSVVHVRYRVRPYHRSFTEQHAQAVVWFH